MYFKEDKMSDLMADSNRTLQVISRFSIPFGVGDKTVAQICSENDIDTDTFLTIINFTNNSLKNLEETILKNKYHCKIDTKTIVKYLQNTHSYFIDFSLPYIRRNLIESLGFSKGNDIAMLIIKFFDEYSIELTKHINIENEKIFPYVESLLNGKKVKPIGIEMSIMHRSPIEEKITELKNIIIKYYSAKHPNIMLYNVLSYLISCEEDLAIHCAIEKYLFIPQIKELEKNANKSKQNIDLLEESEEVQGDLTTREKEIIIGVVKGLTNKEIADDLFISINTVTTHRRNIAKKLNIHSPSGLTIYAIVNNLVDIKDIKQ